MATRKHNIVFGEYIISDQFSVYSDLTLDEIESIEGIYYVRSGDDMVHTVTVDPRYDVADVKGDLARLADAKATSAREPQSLRALRAAPEVFEFIRVYVPEAEVLDLDDALKLACERDASASRQLACECEIETGHAQAMQALVNRDFPAEEELPVDIAVNSD